MTELVFHSYLKSLCPVIMHPEVTLKVKVESQRVWDEQTQSSLQPLLPASAGGLHALTYESSARVGHWVNPLTQVCLLKAFVIDPFTGDLCDVPEADSDVPHTVCRLQMHLPHGGRAGRSPLSRPAAPACLPGSKCLRPRGGYYFLRQSALVCILFSFSSFEEANFQLNSTNPCWILVNVRYCYGRCEDYEVTFARLQVPQRQSQCLPRILAP